MAVQSPGRSALIAAMVALPIFGVAAIATIGTSSMASPAERVSYELGGMQAIVTMVSPPDPTNFQDPAHPEYFEFDYNEMGGAPYHHVEGAPILKIQDVLPAGTRALPIIPTQLTVRTQAGLGSVGGVVGQPWDPAFAGRYDLLDGKRPTSPSEIVATPSAMKRLGAQLGDTVEVTAPKAGTYTVVGTMRDSMAPASTQELFGQIALPRALTEQSPFPGSYYLPDLKLDWPAVQALNKQGAAVLSRDVLENPVDARFYYADGFTSFGNLMAGVAIFAAFAIFEVGLLAGAAFMVGARQQQRALAILASVGGDRRTLFRVVSFGGLVLGAVGGLAGIILGVVGSWIFIRLTDDGSSIQYPGFHPQLFILLGVFVFAVAAGWLSALLPARAASRTDVVGALRGATRPATPTRRKPVIGFIVLALGTALAFAGGILAIAIARTVGPQNEVLWNTSLVLIAAGPILMQVGVLFLTPVVLRLAARGLSVLGSGARLGSRDAARNSSRTVPAVAAIMSTVFLASALMAVVGAYQVEQNQSYQYVTGMNSARAILYGHNDNGQATSSDEVGVDPAAVADALDDSFGVSTARVLSSSPEFAGALGKKQTEFVVPRPKTPDDYTNPYLSSSGTSVGDKIWVGSDADLEAILGEPLTAESRATLAAGGAVSLYPSLVKDGKVNLDWFTDETRWPDDGVPKPLQTQVLAATVQQPPKPIEFAVFMSPAAADSINLPYGPSTVLVPLKGTPSTAQTDRANAAMENITGNPSVGIVTVETGPPPFAQLVSWAILGVSGLIVLGAASVALGLARADGRRDDAVLGAVGAPPGLRRSIGFWQAIVIAGIGTIVGVVFGLVPPLVLAIPPATGGEGLLPFDPPWVQLAIAAVGVPLVIAVGSWLTASGSKLLKVNRSAW